jgi:hypothetical protein
MDLSAWIDLGIKVVTFIGAIGALLASLRNRIAIQEVHLSINSRLTELIKSTSEAAHAAGRAEGLQMGQPTVTQGEKPADPQ